MGERIEPLLLRWPRALAQGLASALLPSACALCGEEARDAVCVPCTLRYAAPDGPRCPCCANPLGLAELPGQACGACLAINRLMMSRSSPSITRRRSTAWCLA